MAYVDGYLLPVPTAHLKTYQKIATKAGKVWMKYGALAYYECAGDDLVTKWSKRSFPQAANAKKGETTIFSFVIFKSKAHRTQVNAKVMKDPFMTDPAIEQTMMPFDMKRMAYGGFKPIVALAAKG